MTKENTSICVLHSSVLRTVIISGQDENGRKPMFYNKRHISSRGIVVVLNTSQLCLVAPPVLIDGHHGGDDGAAPRRPGLRGVVVVVVAADVAVSPRPPNEAIAVRPVGRGRVVVGQRPPIVVLQGRVHLLLRGGGGPGRTVLLLLLLRNVRGSHHLLLLLLLLLAMVRLPEAQVLVI